MYTMQYRHISRIPDYFLSKEVIYDMKRNGYLPGKPLGCGFHIGRLESR